MINTILLALTFIIEILYQKNISNLSSDLFRHYASLGSIDSFPNRPGCQHDVKGILH